MTSSPALCTDPMYAGRLDELWFAHTTEQKPAVVEAIRICYRCPIRLACLREALSEEGSANKADRHGIRGGLTGYQRRLVFEELVKRKTGQRPKRKRAECGTRSGYQRHLREGTEICAPCRQANRDADNLRRTGTTKTSRQPAPCGTRGGYQRHRRDGEAACDACRQANTDADNRLRRTGTTKVAA
ncbi:WhiB family transcriptional regulator [Streptomyces sp. DSM 40750]|uniref:WhiB family transcriptional regulator n=1 Tax=Streptomyces sp. DSM 40750 TaxID=2801030 RepID=UPI00214D081E|nr:WhiB family transcriptional regulator [Streptomyces sp. DSM 40750]UUU21683.1 WhiB family transcriptional regulator [Streptomyces sp. DSM 40750]